MSTDKNLVTATSKFKMTEPNLGETKLPIPKDIFRVAVIGQQSEDVEHLFQKLTGTDQKLSGPSTCETVRREGRSVTFWALRPDGDHGIRALLSPFGDTFHVVIVTFDRTAMKPSTELLQSVLEFESTGRKPFAVVEFGRGESPDDERLHDVIKSQSVAVVFPLGSHEEAIRWTEDNLRHSSRESESIDWTRVSWPNLNLNVGQLPLTASYYKCRMVAWFRTKCMDLGLLKRPIRVLMLPREGGRTTFLYRLKLGEVVATIPTIGFNVETGRKP